MLDSLNLALDFFLPAIVEGDLSLFVFALEFSNFVEFSFLFHFEEGLLNGFCEEHIQYWLNFTVVVKKVKVFNLSNLVDASLFGNILRGGGSRHKNICLALDIVFLGLLSTLLGKEISQIDLNSGRGSRIQIVGRSLGLCFLEVLELGLDHINFLYFTLGLNANLVLLRRGHVFLAAFKSVNAVSVSAEHTLVIHDVKCFATCFFLVIFKTSAVGVAVLEFLLAANHLGLGSLKSLGHIFGYKFLLI